MPMRRESGRASGTGPPKKSKKIRKVSQNSKTSSLGSNAAAAHGYKPTGKPVPKQTRGQRQDLKPRAVPSQREKEFEYATRMRRTQPAEAKRQGDIVRTARKLKAKYDLATGNYVRTNKRRFLPDEKVVIDPKTKKPTTDITAATKQAGVQHAETVAPALKVLEQTQRTVKATAGGARAAIRGEGPVGILKAQKKGLLENKGPTWGKVLHEDLKVPKPAAAVAGFAADIATDPTTYVTGGSGKVAVKGAEKAAKDAAKKAAAKGMSDAGVKTVQKAAAKKAVRQAGAKGERTGITVKLAGKELPGVRTGTAAVGAGLKRVTPSRARTGARETVAHVRPQITPTGMTKAEHVLNRQTERRARAQRSRGVREAQALAEAHRGRLKPEEWEQVQHAIETRKLKNLPDHLRQPAIDIRSANRAALRERRAAGVSQGDVTRRPAKPVQVSKPPKIVKTREFGKTGEREIVRTAGPTRAGRSGTPPAQTPSAPHEFQPPPKFGKEPNPKDYRIVRNEDEYGRELGEKFQVETTDGRLVGVAETRKQANEILNEDIARAKREHQSKYEREIAEHNKREEESFAQAPLDPETRAGVEDYGKSAFLPMNERLRGLEKPMSKRGQELNDAQPGRLEGINKRLEGGKAALDRAIEKQPPSTRPVVLHRFRFRVGDKPLQVGEEFTEKGFTSTSKQPEAYVKGHEPGERFRIHVPAGVKWLDMNRHKTGRSVQENEIVLPRGMTFRVDKVTEREGGRFRDYDVTIVPKSEAKTPATAKLRVQQFGPREVSRAVGRKQTARMVRPKREPGAPKEYMPHMRASLIEGEQEAAKAGAKGGTRKIGSTMKRQMNVPVREANERLGADERFSTNVPLVQANYRVQTANAVAGARMARDLGERAPKVIPGRTKEIPEGHAVYRLHNGKLEEVDDAALARMEKGETVVKRGRVKKDGKWVTVTREERVPAAHGKKADKAGQLIHLNKQQVESFKKQFIDDRTAAGKGFDFVQGKWKRAATFTPGFHIRNMIGDTQMAYLAQPGHRMPANVAVAGKGLKRMTQREATLRKTGARPEATGKTVKIAGKDTNLDEFLDGAINEGVIRSGMIARGINDAASEGRAAAGEQVSRATVKGLRQAAKTGKKGAPYRTVKRGFASVGRGTQNREDLMRLATYKHGLDKGLTPPEAADLASAFHIDYGDVTDFERKVARRAAPFYTFSARALPIHVKALVNTPGKIAAIEKARQELAYGMGLDDGWEGQTPEWKQRAIPFGVSVKGEKVALDAALPVSMLNELPTSVNPKDYALEMWKFGTGLLTPAVKIPIEVGTGQSLFFRKPIKNEYTPYVSAPGWVKWLPENIRNGLGVVEKQDKRSGEMVPAWDPWTNYAFRQLPGLATQFQQITTPGALQSGRHDWQKVSGVAGVKADPIDPTTANITRLFNERNKLAAEANKLRPLPGGAGGRSAKNPRVRALTKKLAELDYQIYQNSVERGDAVPQREGAIKNKDLLKPRVKQRGVLKKSDDKAAAKKRGGGSGWGGGASTGSGW